jgi:hypothetical protein
MPDLNDRWYSTPTNVANKTGTPIQEIRYRDEVDRIRVMMILRTYASRWQLCTRKRPFTNGGNGSIPDIALNGPDSLVRSSATYAELDR